MIYSQDSLPWVTHEIPESSFKMSFAYKQRCELLKCTFWIGYFALTSQNNNAVQTTYSYQPAGDQPGAIRQLTEGILEGEKFQTLLGVTGSGKTFTIANVIQNVQKPTLVLTHNKTLVAQLYGEFKQFFRKMRWDILWVSYDYYQPEAYMPVSDTYIEKIWHNEELDKLRLQATSELLSGRRDIIVVASVSCIYGMGIQQSLKMELSFAQQQQTISRQGFLHALVNSLYTRTQGISQEEPFV